MPSTSTLRSSPALPFFESALDAAPDAIIIADHRGLVQYANAQVSALFGYAHGEIIGMGIETLTPERFRVQHVALRNQYFGDPHVRPMGAGRNLLGRRRDGTEFALEISLSPLRSGENPWVICIARDVTEHRKLEEALRQATQQLERRAAASDARAKQTQENLRLFVDHAPAAVAMLDRDMRHVLVSNRWLEDYGLANRNITGTSHYEHFPELPERWKEAHRRALAGESLRSEEDSFVRADGRLEWLRWELLPWRTEDGEIGGIMLVSEVITRRKLAEQALLKSHEELETRVAERTRELEAAKNEATQANAAKSRFLAAASHDLRQPLQTIWSLQATLARTFKDSDYAPHLALLEEAVRNMDQMLSALIDINRLEQGSIHPVIRDFPLNDILARLRSEFAYAASAKSLVLDMEDSRELARSDAMLLPVILRNLIGNAIKYTQRGTIRLRVRTDDTQLFIDIIDTGPGIPPAHLQRLFDAYYQVDNPNRDQTRGVGLGLSIVQTICKLLGHTVTVESAVGKGSTFTLRLPRGVRMDDAPATPIAIPVAAQAPPAGTVTVLHIEDDPGVARSMAMLLRLEGYEVIGVATRDEALQQVTTHALRPDLILSDYNLPMGFSGDEVVAEIAVSLGFKPPTIMLTGDIADKHLRQAKLVADRILPKPVDVALLLSCMSALLEQKAASGDSPAAAGVH
jgi:PAS domain S-box-containing protein